MNLATAFAASAHTHASRPAIYWGEQEFSFDEVWRQSRRFAATLRARFGVRRGDRVGLWLKNCPEFVPALFGILNLDAVVVPINNFLKAEEIHHIVADAGIDVVITDGSTAEVARKLLEMRPGLRLWSVDAPAALPENASAGLALPESRESDLAVIIYTSGTTGRPKGAMLSHGNLLSNVESCRIVLEAAATDRFVVLLPMFHSFMLTVGILLPMLVGGSMLVIKSVHPPKNILLEIMHRRPTILPAVPAFFRTLLSVPLPSNFPLRLCISGGAPLPVELLREFNARMPLPLIEGYGLSEASPVVSINPIHGPWKEGSIGKPIRDVEVSVQDDNGQELPVGATGEICVRGPNVMLGYWRQEEETARTIRNGWLLTGDIGHRDADGFFYITDRKKDMLLVNGINVYPREIEEILYRFPGVKEAAVIGIPDHRRGEQPLAFVSPIEGIEIMEKALIEFARERLADYKVPRRVVFLPALPRNATGKILKTHLRQQALTVVAP
ncbi:MAG TPA: long-chain fatty acid--CoA ligase [Methylomirabilota bacterium]|nr:long-chain fatty acid--CoA ligase [Methylomirabilota bacterium]